MEQPVIEQGKKIIIPAEEMKRFGGIEICLTENNLKSLQNCEVELSGNFDSICMNYFYNYLKENKIRLKSLKLPDGKSIEKIYGFRVVNKNTEAIKSIENIIKKINTPENKKLWGSLVNNYKFFSSKGPEFWKEHYEKIKTSLPPMEEPLEDNTLRALYSALQKNPDAEKNLHFVKSQNLFGTPFFKDCEELVKLLKTFTKDNRACNYNCRETDVLLYITELLHPREEELFFIEAKNGIELLVPELNLYLFFPDFEMNLIVPYFDYLKRNFISITNEYAAFIKARMGYLFDQSAIITANARKQMIEKLKEQKIQTFLESIEAISKKYNISIQEKEMGDRIIITLLCNAKFEIEFQSSYVVENYDSAIKGLEDYIITISKSFRSGGNE